jgi:hypothetical protein
LSSPNFTFISKGCIRNDTVNKTLLAKENGQIYIIIYYYILDFLFMFSYYFYIGAFYVYIYINWNLKFVTIYISVYFEKIHKNKIINNDINLTIFFCKQCFINGVISNASLADKGEIR